MRNLPGNKHIHVCGMPYGCVCRVVCCANCGFTLRTHSFRLMTNHNTSNWLLIKLVIKSSSSENTISMNAMYPSRLCSPSPAMLALLSPLITFRWKVFASDEQRLTVLRWLRVSVAVLWLWVSRRAVSWCVWRKSANSTNQLMRVSIHEFLGNTVDSIHCPDSRKWWINEATVNLHMTTTGPPAAAVAATETCSS